MLPVEDLDSSLDISVRRPPRKSYLELYDDFKREELERECRVGVRPNGR